MKSFHVVSMAVVACCATAACSAEDIDDGYIPVPNVEAEAGDPALMTGYSLVDAAKTDNAVCLDGTPGLYYHRPGTSTGAKKWYIHQEGGGWCSDVAACHGRPVHHWQALVLSWLLDHPRGRRMWSPPVSRAFLRHAARALSRVPLPWVCTQRAFFSILNALRGIAAGR